jgi:hypothetical protein
VSETAKRTEAEAAFAALLADDLRYALDYSGPAHAHQRPGVWDESGRPCGHCARLAAARTHLVAFEASMRVSAEGDEEGDELVCVDQCGCCDACGMEPFGTPAEGWREAARFLRRVARSSGDREGVLHGARLIEAELRRQADGNHQERYECRHTEAEHRRQRPGWTREACSVCECVDYVPPSGIRGILGYVGIDTAGRDIKVAGKVVDAWNSDNTGPSGAGEGTPQ